MCVCRSTWKCGDTIHTGVRSIWRNDGAVISNTRIWVGCSITIEEKMLICMECGRKRFIEIKIGVIILDITDVSLLLRVF